MTSRPKVPVATMLSLYAAITGDHDLDELFHAPLRYDAATMGEVAPADTADDERDGDVASVDEVPDAD